MDYADCFDVALRETINSRLADWRNGAVVYQVLVDRFAPSACLDAKRHLYPAPKVLKRWDEQPRMGRYLDDEGLWSHEIEFWGGDLASLQSRLDYVVSLGVDVLYLNPIHLAYTNHKYDSLDFAEVSPEFGNRQDVINLAAACHENDLRLMLDGVFNHMGQNARVFKDALSHEDSDYREWFVFDDSLRDGYLCWDNARNLPELNLEYLPVREHIYLAEDSVVQQYLRDGVDGWRLDVAHDIGFTFLRELTDSAHAAKPDAWVVGESWCYPPQWLACMDGLMNFTLRQLVLSVSRGELRGGMAGQLIDQMVSDSDYEGLLKSWLMLDNHDTPRLPNVLPLIGQRRLAQVLQFTLPASPNLYYGSELGLQGGDDPEMRGPMDWETAERGCEELSWVRCLIALRKANPALRVGNWRYMPAEHLLAFERYTDKISESVFVVVNPSEVECSELLMLRNSKVMNGNGLNVLLASETAEAERIWASTMRVKIPAGGYLLVQPNTDLVNGYSTYKRV